MYGFEDDKRRRNTLALAQSYIRTYYEHYMKAIAYCRVSTTGQAEQGVSLEMQRERIVAWCTANDYVLETVFIESMSGGKASNRPELQKAILTACKGQGVLGAVWE